MQPRLPRPDVEIRIGVDLVPVDRLTRLLAEHPAARDELFTEQEQAYCDRKRRREEHLAARFAAKEATLKALGSGLSTALSWRDVEVWNEPTGRPRIRLHGGALRMAQRRRVIDVDVSLTHAAGLAIASALVVSASLRGSGLRETGGREPALAGRG